MNKTTSDVSYRLELELKDLLLKVGKLREFLKDETKLNTVNSFQRELLFQQFSAMKLYLSILLERYSELTETPRNV